uniref:Protein kinase domain-containing protein n=1 Tax=Bionectria ochroleuca TaxID=29856 RepID=A0A8H7TSP3_BIOOC
MGHPTRWKLPTETIRFRFGSRLITATGTASDHVHRHVLRDWFPEWCLPERIVFKKQKEGWDEEFDQEKVAYAKLRPIQGITIPRFYGAITYNGTRAIILSDIGGACVASPEGAVLDEKDFHHQLLYKALTTLTGLGVSHDDSKLDNLHLVTEDGKDKIMMVDLERVDMDLSEDDFAFAAYSKADFLTRQYRSHLRTLEYDGVLLPKRLLKA